MTSLSDKTSPDAHLIGLSAEEAIQANNRAALEKSRRETELGVELSKLVIEFGVKSMLRVLGIAVDIASGRKAAGT